MSTTTKPEKVTDSELLQLLAEKKQLKKSYNSCKTEQEEVKCLRALANLVQRIINRRIQIKADAAICKASRELKKIY